MNLGRGVKFVVIVFFFYLWEVKWGYTRIKMLGLVLLSCGSSKVGRGELNTQLPHDIKKLVMLAFVVYATVLVTL